ncbi:MAG: hypothetical protein H6774_04645 [Pseudomonadales bacterium]|nr:hypothetical protein [Pseudomonadales bacterium]
MSLTSYKFTIIGVLYRHLLKPILFLFDPESVHNTMIKIGVFLGNHNSLKKITSWVFAYHHPSLQHTHANIVFENPVGLSAGFDYNGQLTDILPSLGFGWHTIGTVTYQPYKGNQRPQLIRLPHSRSILVNKGLKNWGAVRIAQTLEKKTLTIPTGISIAATNTAYSTTTEQLLDILCCFHVFETSHVQHQYYELNISCPNTFAGEPFTTPERLGLLLDVLNRYQITKPIFIKMPIELTNSEARKLLDVCLDHDQVKGVIFGNLSKDKTNPAVTQKDTAIWKKHQGNLSGKPTWQRSTQLVKLAKDYCQGKLVVVGTGGVFTPQDAQEKLGAGADLVQLITGMIYNGPQVVGEINLCLSR